MTATRSHLSSGRRRPRQQRSHQLVGAILEATKRVLGHNGLGGTSIRAIAKVAGVSAGSLYQYFDGKDSLVGTLIENRLAADLEDIRVLLASAERLALVEAVRMGCDRIVPDQAWKKDALLAMVDSLGEVQRQGQLRTFLERLTSILAHFLGTHHEVTVTDPKRAARMLVFGLRAAALEAMRVQEPWDPVPIRAEIFRMAMGLLADVSGGSNDRKA